MTMTMATARPRQSGTISARMSILTVLISLAIIAQEGRTVCAVQVPPAVADAAVVRANANGGAGAGRSGTGPQRHSPSLRLGGNAYRLLAESMTSTEATESTAATTTEDEVSAEDLTAAYEDISGAVEEKLESGEKITPEDEEGLVEAMEELNELVEETAEAAGDQDLLAALANETDPEAIMFPLDSKPESPEDEEEIVFPGDSKPEYPEEEAKTTTAAYPEKTEEEATTVAATEPTIDAPEATEGATEAPPQEEFTIAAAYTTPATTTIGEEEDVNEEKESTPLIYESGTVAPGEEDEEDINEEEKGMPLIYESGTVSPAPTAAEDAVEWGWEEEEETMVPTPAGDAGKWDYGSPYERYPTFAPTPRPTSLYVPKDGDPLATEEEADIEAFGDDAFYHNLGGPVGAYLDGVESPQDMEKDKNVQIVAGTLAGLFIVMMLVTAHLLMQYPDGLCSGCCRLTLKIICCFTRTLCLPCRAICCKGSDQSQGRRTHAPMRTPFPSDLELA